MGTVADTASLASMGLAGLLGAALGIPWVYLLSGVLCAIAGLVAMFGLPSLRLQQGEQEQISQEPTELKVEKQVAQVA